MNHFCGHVHVRALPSDCSLADYRAWWPRIGERERERLSVATFDNILTTGGRTALLTFLSNQTSILSGFAQFFALGIFPISNVSPGDTSLLTEVYRVAPTSTAISGQKVDLSIYLGPNQANANFTDAGLFGGGASAAAGSGTLYTHTLFTYSKAVGTAISVDYAVSFT